MVLYLVQHGEAEREEINPARPLTGKGRDDVRKVALFAAGAEVRVERILWRSMMWSGYCGNQN